MNWNIPNFLTIGRLIAAPCVALVFVVFDRPLADWLAFWIFVGAGATDFLDGWLARRWGQVSELGKMLDPIADKAMVIIALSMIVALGGLTALLVVPMAIILTREILISGVREFLGDFKLPVTKAAKFKTSFQMLAIGTLFLFFATGEPMLSFIGYAILWIAAGLTFLTGWDYFSKAMAHLRKRENT